MISLFWFLFWGTLTALVVVSFVSLRTRLRRRLEQKRPRVDDDAIRRIVQTGRLASEEDEPLDMEEIEEEERRFWSESWDEPEEW
jgi:hypothetical protein